VKELRTEIEFEGTPQEVWEVLADLLIDEAGPGRVRFTQSERFGGILLPLLWRRLRDGGTSKGFRAMNEAIARRVAESHPHAVH
jgi:hypothetical protein